MTTPYEIRPIGHVESPLVDRESAPKQGSEGAPDAWLVFDPDVAEGIRDLAVGTDVFVLTWLHQSRRDVLAVHPRDDPRNLEMGVFSTRSEVRPNPIGVHRVRIAAIDGLGCSCGISKPSTRRPSWTLSPYSPVGGKRRADLCDLRYVPPERLDLGSGKGSASHGRGLPSVWLIVSAVVKRTS